MAAKKLPAKKVPSPKKPASAADFRKKEEEDKRIARETKRNPKDASGNSYFGSSNVPMTGQKKTPGPKFPPGTPWQVIKPAPPKPKSPQPSVTPPKPPKPPTTPIIPTMPRGMNILGILIPSDDKKKKKKK
jgi:hypothetical protein